MLYLSPDCHFLYISVIQLIHRGMGKELCVIERSCHQIPVSVLLGCVLSV